VSVSPASPTQLRPSQLRPAALAAELRIALMRSTRRLRAEKADADLSDAQYAVLAYLDRAGPSTPRALAEFERVKPPTMTRTLAGLADLGLVERQGHPEDGRQVLVRATPAGRRSVQETRRRRDAWLAQRLAELDEGERATLAAAAVLLRRIADT
jgi:DNA-binding MarR family transcriptional regulator